MVIMRTKSDIIDDKMDVVYRHIWVGWFGEAEGKGNVKDQRNHANNSHDLPLLKMCT